MYAMKRLLNWRRPSLKRRLLTKLSRHVPAQPDRPGALCALPAAE
jgi:hypothetical protein